jgi:hypothetical protein
MEVFMQRVSWATLAPLLLGLSACSSDMQSGMQSGDHPMMQSSSTPSAYSGSSQTSSNRGGYRQTLQQHGYSQISDPQQSGQNQIGNAVDPSGQLVQFVIDPGGDILVHIQ